jgi:hypothetical protein
MDMKTKEHDVKVTYTIVGEETELQDPNKLEISQIAQQFVWLIRQQPAVLFSQNKPAPSNKPAVLFSQNKSTLATSHQPNEQAAS